MGSAGVCSRLLSGGLTSQGLIALTPTLQSGGEPAVAGKPPQSKMSIFPDEGRWVLKSQHSQLWYQTFPDWVGQCLR